MIDPKHTTIFECSACGAQHNTGSRGLPVGWSTLAGQGSVWCNDCTAAGIPARTIVKPARRSGKKAARHTNRAMAQASA